MIIQIIYQPHAIACGWFFFFRKGMMQRENRADRTKKKSDTNKKVRQTSNKVESNNADKRVEQVGK